MPLNEGPEKEPPGALVMLCVGVLVGGVGGHILGIMNGPVSPRDWSHAIEMVPDTWQWWVGGEFLGAAVVAFLYRKHIM